MDKQKIMELLADVIHIPAEKLAALPGDTSLTDLGLTSLPFIEFIVKLENAFSFQVLDRDLILADFQTPDRLFATLAKYFTGPAVPRKVLVCDCDNCLWHGVAGEEPISLDAGLQTLHASLLDFYKNGVLLCICSRNTFSNIHSALSLLDSTLQPEHFLIVKAGQDKVKSMTQLSAELSLSLDSFVFLDDSDYELGLIEALLPEVTCIKADPTILSPFGHPAFWDELEFYFGKETSDLDRTRLYREQKERQKCKEKFTDIAQYNASLMTTTVCERASDHLAGRIAQLSRRTNQFNLSAARYETDTVSNLLASSDHTVLFLSAADKYGDMGVVGAAVILHTDPPVIEAFFLSCRVFDRGFEDILLNKIKELFPNTLKGVFRETDKNQRFRNFYAKHGVAYEQL